MKRDPSVKAPSLRHNRDYVLLFSGQTISECGTQLTQIAFPLLVLGLTRSPAQAGITAGLRLIPYLSLSLLAGALVDRWDRKRTMIICDMARALLLISIPVALWMGHLSIIQLYVVSLLEGTFYVFFGLAFTAGLPQVVQTGQLPAATAQSEGVFQITKVVGPLLGGLLYAVGRLVPFLIDALSYAVSVVSLLFVRTEFQGERQRGPSARTLRSEIAEGLRWLWDQPLVRSMAFLSAIAWIMLAALPLVVIVLAREQHVKPAAIGLVLALSGVGGMAGALVAGRLQDRFSFGQIIIASTWLWALLWPLYSIAGSPAALAAVTGLLYIVWPIYNVTQFSYRRALIPDQLQGRVNSAFRLIAFTGQPVGMVLAGFLLQTIGGRDTVLVLALAPLALALSATLDRQVRSARSIREVEAT